MARAGEMSRSGTVHIGISGWAYGGWRGNFYPPGLRRADELHYASRQVDTIEINGTHYSLQRSDSFARWRDETPEGFVFAVKGSRFIHPPEAAPGYRNAARQFLCLRRIAAGGQARAVSMAILAPVQVRGRASPPFSVIAAEG
jgi:uncharacterized protein YecE (DUF72 family)